MVAFDELIVGREYTRPFLAKLWNYKTFNAISRGVITPRDQNIIVLFITKDNQETLTQYADRIDNDQLFWEGEIGHGSDNRIVAQRDEIHVFYRVLHHQNLSTREEVYSAISGCTRTGRPDSISSSSTSLNLILI